MCARTIQPPSEVRRALGLFKCSHSQGFCGGTNDENAHGSPEKGGQPPETLSSCRPAVGPLRALTCSFLASALLLDWLPFPVAWGVWSFRKKPQQGRLQ